MKVLKEIGKWKEDRKSKNCLKNEGEKVIKKNCLEYQNWKAEKNKRKV